MRDLHMAALLSGERHSGMEGTFMREGIIYIAAGTTYVEEALFSAASAKRHMPQLPITLFADRVVESPYLDEVVVMDPQYNPKQARIHYLQHSPYERTLFLDTDTYICADFGELFELLDRFEIAGTHTYGQKTYPAPGVPESFPEYNGGVILFRNTERVRAVFRRWLAIFNEQTWVVKGRRFDQPALREALYTSDLHLGTFTSQYDCRFVNGSCVAGDVKILHQRSYFEFAQVAEVLNRTANPRICIGDRAFEMAKIEGMIPRVEARLLGTFGKTPANMAVDRLRRYLHQEGVGGTLRRVWQRLRGQV